MKPGRELDVLVAEKAMGLAQKEMSGGSCLGWYDASGKQLYWPDTTYSDEDVYLPEYSTDISAAWEVVEKLRDDNFSLEENGTHWKARFGEHWAGSESAPMAICLAALRAKGIEV